MLSRYIRPKRTVAKTVRDKHLKVVGNYAFKIDHQEKEIYIKNETKILRIANVCKSLKALLSKRHGFKVQHTLPL